MKQPVKLKINGVDEIVEVNPYDTLNKVLREYLGLTGTKRGCDYGGCGSCTAIVNGRAIYSCMMPILKIEGADIRTIEGLAEDGKLHPVQDSFVRLGAVQCGYCTPGLIMAAKAFLDENISPTEEDVKESIAGNLCRCTGYVKVIEAIMDAAKTMRSQKGPYTA